MGLVFKLDKDINEGDHRLTNTKPAKMVIRVVRTLFFWINRVSVGCCGDCLVREGSGVLLQHVLNGSFAYERGSPTPAVLV